MEILYNVFEIIVTHIQGPTHGPHMNPHMDPHTNQHTWTHMDPHMDPYTWTHMWTVSKFRPETLLKIIFEVCCNPYYTMLLLLYYTNYCPLAPTLILPTPSWLPPYLTLSIKTRFILDGLFKIITAICRFGLCPHKSSGTILAWIKYWLSKYIVVSAQHKIYQYRWFQKQKKGHELKLLKLYAVSHFWIKTII